MIQKLCKNCNEAFTQYNTLQKLCAKCSFNKTMKPKKPMRKIGPVTRKWFETRNQYIQDHPPGQDGKWPCELKISPLCLGRMDIDQLTLDHIIARSKRPDLRFDPINLQTACLYCNNQKGSS